MKRIFPLVIVISLVAIAAAQSGRRVTTPPSQPAPPIQAPIWSQPEPVPSAAREEARGELITLPESLRNRQLMSLDKSTFRLADFEGKVIVLNLWASWCGPCRMEVPEYEKVRKAYVGRDVEFIALTTEDPRSAGDRVRQFVREVNFRFRLGWADRDTAMTLMNGRSSIPQTLVIGADGRIVSHWRGYSRSQGGDRLRETLERALSQSTTASGDHQKSKLQR